MGRVNPWVKCVGCCKMKIYGSGQPVSYEGRVLQKDEGIWVGSAGGLIGSGVTEDEGIWVGLAGGLIGSGVAERRGHMGRVSRRVNWVGCYRKTRAYRSG